MDRISSWLSSTLSKRTKMPFVMALFHTAGSASGRIKPQPIEIGLHIEQQAAAGDKVHPKNVVRERCDG